MVLLKLKKKFIITNLININVFKKSLKKLKNHVKKKSGYNVLSKKTILSKSRKIKKLFYIKQSHLYLKNQISLIVSFKIIYKKRIIISILLNSIGMWFYNNITNKFNVGFFLTFFNKRFDKKLDKCLYIKHNYIIFFNNFVKYSFLKSTISKIKIASSFGTCFVILNMILIKNKILILLPSKNKKILKNANKHTAYFDTNNTHLIEKKKTAGFFKNYGVRSIVRGTVKNPNDHPHGGRTKRQYQFKNPWGNLFKNNK